MSAGTCLIFAGGPEAGMPCLPLPESPFVLCADSGLRTAQALGVKPDLVLGDFDSLGFVPQALPHQVSPAEKDDTDTMLCVRTALSRGFRSILIAGAFGGRLDHTAANLQTMEFALRHGAVCTLAGPDNFACLQQSGTARYKRIDGFSFSVLAWTETCRGVTLSGTQYPLENGTLTRSFPLGVSNAITGDYAEVTCTEGILLIIGSRL